MKIQDQLRAQYVTRWHIVETNKRQTLAEHSFNVALILLEIARRANIILSKEALEYALTHDLSEVLLGDIPTPTKIAMKKALGLEKLPVIDDDKGVGPKPLSDQAKSQVKLVKLADLLEMATFIIQHAASPHGDYVAGYVNRLLTDFIKTECTGNWEYIGKIAQDIYEDITMGDYST